MKRLILAIGFIPVVVAAQSPATRQVTLSEALAAGRATGTAALLARIDSRLASGKAAIARSALLPSITGTVAADRQTRNLDEFGLPGIGGTTDPFTLFQARVGVSQVLFDRGAAARLSAASDSALAAGADAERVTTLTEAAAGAAWLRLAQEEQLVRARKADSATAQTLLGIAHDKVLAGTAALIEQTRSETRAQVTRSELAEARHELARAGLELARAMQLPASTPLETDGIANLALAIPTDPDSAVAVARRKRRDLAAARIRLAVARDRIHSQSMTLWPTLVARGLVQETGQHTGELSPTWSFGVGLSWELFNGLSHRREVDQARLRTDAARIRLSDLDRSVASEARLALIDIASAREQMTITSEQLRLALVELGQARDRLDAGVAGTVETTTAEASVSAARDAVIQARISFSAAQLSAARALGLLGHEDYQNQTGAAP